MPELTINEMMQGLGKSIPPEKISGVNTKIQFRTTGEEPGDWIIQISDGKCIVNPGTTPTPVLTIIIDTQVFKDLSTGKLNPMAAYMQGKIRLTGDMSLAMRIANLFQLGKL